MPSIDLLEMLIGGGQPADLLFLHLLVSLILLLVQGGDGRSVKIKQNEVWTGDKIEATNIRVVDDEAASVFDFHENDSDNTEDVKVSGGRKDSRGDFKASEESREIEADEENGGKQTERKTANEAKESTKTKDETEEIEKSYRNETKEVDADENGKAEQSELKDTEQVEAADNVEINQSFKKKMVSQQRDMEEQVEKEGNDDSERKVESNKEETTESKSDEKEEVVGKKGLGNTQKVNVEGIGKEENVEETKKENMREAIDMQFENFKFLIEEVEGEIMDFSSLNEEKGNKLSLVKKEKEAKIAKLRTGMDMDSNHEKNDKEGEEDIVIPKLNVLPIAAALHISIMSVDYNNSDIGMKIAKTEKVEVEVSKNDAPGEEPLNVETGSLGTTADLGPLDAWMLPTVSVTLEHAIQDLVPKELETFDASPQKDEEKISIKDEIVRNHVIQTEDILNTTTQCNIGSGGSSTIDLSLKSNKTGSIDVSPKFDIRKTHILTESPTTVYTSNTTEEPKPRITTTTTTIKSTIAEPMITTPPRTSQLSSSLPASFSTCLDLPNQLCSPLPSPPPHTASLMVANLADGTMEHHLLLSCLSTRHTTNLQEVVRAVLVRLPWTDMSSLKEKSLILATAFPKQELMARLEHVDIDGREVVKIVSASTSLPHQEYLEPGTSRKLEERKKLLLEVATIIHRKQAGAGKEETEMAGCRYIHHIF